MTGCAFVRSMYVGTSGGQDRVMLWAYWAVCDVCGWRGDRFRRPTEYGQQQAQGEVMAHNRRWHQPLVLDVTPDAA